MSNKVLIKLYVPMLDTYYDLFVPVNELMWKVNKLIVKSVSDLSGGNLSLDKNYVLINSETGKVYENNVVVLNTDIRNATNLLLIEI